MGSVGFTLLAIGGVADVVFHLLPDEWARLVLPMVGQDGGRAHLVTAAGLGVLLFAGLYKALLATRTGR